MTCDDGAYAAVIRQAAHDAVRALLAAPPDRWPVRARCAR